MLSVGGSRAKTLALQAKEQVWPESEADSGSSSPVSFANYDPNSCSWRSSQHCLDGERETFSGSWPRSGMMRNGTAYLLHTLAYSTRGTASGLWPTPAARDHHDLSRKGAYSSALARKSPSLATLSLARGRSWQEVPAIYAAVMGFPLDWHNPQSTHTGTP